MILLPVAAVITIQVEVFSILIIGSSLMIFFIIANRAL